MLLAITLHTSILLPNLIFVFIVLHQWSFETNIVSRQSLLLLPMDGLYLLPKYDTNINEFGCN